MKQRVGLPDAAKELGVAPQAVREHMKRGLWDLGEVVTNVKPNGKKRYRYYIFRPKLDRLIGKEKGSDA